MPTFLKLSLPALLLAFAAASASATVVQLGTVNKTYGSAGGAVASTGSGSCDTLNANSITVRDTSSGCGRFNDKFDFSALHYSSIDHLTLTLNFSGTNNFYLGLFAEDWKVRAADSLSHGSASLLDMNNVSGATAQSFTINAAQADVFSNISHNGVFYLWFADQGFGPNNFNLSSASLAVHGTAVPEPGSLALLALALAGVGVMRRRQA